MGILGKRVRKYVIDSPISHSLFIPTVTSHYIRSHCSQSGTRQWPGPCVWQRVGGGGLITTDYSIIYSNRFQACEHWPLDNRETLTSVVITWDLIWYLAGCMCWPHYCDRDQASGSAHSLSHYIVPESHWPHVLTPVPEIDVIPELGHFKLGVNWVTWPITPSHLISPVELSSNKL